jgi:heat shock protein HslJ
MESWLLHRKRVKAEKAGSTRKPCDPRHDDMLITVFLRPIISKGRNA